MALLGCLAGCQPCHTAQCAFHHSLLVSQWNGPFRPELARLCHLVIDFTRHLLDRIPRQAYSGHLPRHCLVQADRSLCPGCGNLPHWSRTIDVQQCQAGCGEGRKEDATSGSSPRWNAAYLAGRSEDIGRRIRLEAGTQFTQTRIHSSIQSHFEIVCDSEIRCTPQQHPISLTSTFDDLISARSVDASSAICNAYQLGSTNEWINIETKEDVGRRYKSSTANTACRSCCFKSSATDTRVGKRTHGQSVKGWVPRNRLHFTTRHGCIDRHGQLGFRQSIDHHASTAILSPTEDTETLLMAEKEPVKPSNEMRDDNSFT